MRKVIAVRLVLYLMPTDPQPYELREYGMDGVDGVVGGTKGLLRAMMECRIHALAGRKAASKRRELVKLALDGVVTPWLDAVDMGDPPRRAGDGTALFARLEPVFAEEEVA